MGKIEILKTSETGGILVKKYCRTNKKCSICSRIIPKGEVHQAYQEIVVFRVKYYKDYSHFCLSHDVKTGFGFGGFEAELKPDHRIVIN